ncbi:MAG: IS4 family transposase, partial [Isosphaeraceae bacterium]
MIAADGVLSTRQRRPKNVPHLDQVLPTMKAAKTRGLSKPLVHVIDREADSVDHDRQWDNAGHRFLVRSDDRRVKWEGQARLLSEIQGILNAHAAFRLIQAVPYRDTTAQLWVAETSVILYRPSKKSVRGRKFQQSGPALTLRFVVVQLRDLDGHVLAEWMLQSNVP